MVEPLDVAHVYATAPGCVREVHVAPGDHVRKGDLLLKLINRETEQKRRTLEMQRDAQQLELELDEALNDAAQEHVAQTILAGITTSKRIMTVPTAKIVKVWPMPQKMPVIAAFRRLRWWLTMVVTAIT